MRELFTVCFVVAICFHTVQPRPTTTTKYSSFTTLEWALRRVLDEITCQELTESQLKHEFMSNSLITLNVMGLLNNISIQEQEGCREIRQLYFLDYRGGLVSNCTNPYLPRLRLIESATPVFPAYYMDWDCGQDCSESVEGNINYELLQRTNSCSEGTADWTGIEATRSHPLTVTRACIIK